MKTVERLGFCLTGITSLEEESAAPIYVQTIVDVISSSLKLILMVNKSVGGSWKVP